MSNKCCNLVGQCWRHVHLVSKGKQLAVDCNILLMADLNTHRGREYAVISDLVIFSWHKLIVTNKTG